MKCPNPNCNMDRFADRRYCQYCGYDYWEDEELEK